MKVANIIKNIILDLIIILLIAFLVFNHLNNKKPIPIFKHYLLSVLTGSMEPTIMTGDSIIIKESDKYIVNDIVTYKKGNVYVTHRIVAIKGDTVITKGDANDKEDPPIKMDDIIGKYVYRTSFITFILRYKIYLLIGMLIICLIFYLVDVIRN